MDIKWIVLIVAVVMYLLVILKQDKKVWFTTGAALLLVALGTVLPGAIFNDGKCGAPRRRLPRRSANGICFPGLSCSHR